MTKQVLMSILLFCTQESMLCLPGFCQTGTTKNIDRVASRESSKPPLDAGNTLQSRDSLKLPTAQNQSNDRSDIRLSSTLRRKIMHKKSVSVDAENIKIISENGSLVLRGPVKTAQEKQVIDRMARQCCKTMPYKNELEVKNQ